MADKILTESEWKKFAKSRDLKDANLLKALAALDKAKVPDDQLKAIAAIDRELEALKKLAKGDKEALSQLDDMAKALAKEEKAAKQAAKEAESEEEEEEESPVLLTTKMIPLLRQVKKGEEMQVLLARGGKEVAVLMSRRGISPSRRKLLTEYLGDGTPKFHKGVCIFEENSYTFVLETQAAGLAKKVKAALLKQVELRLKVRVRGEDPNDIDDDGEPAEDEGAEREGSEASSTTSSSTSSTTSSSTTAADAPAPQADPAEADFKRRWAQMQPLVQRLIQSGAGDAAKLRAVAEFVSQKGEAGAFKAALQGMDSLQKLVDAAQQGAPAPTAAPTAASTAAPTAPTEDRGKAFNARLAGLLPAIKAVSGDAATPLKLKAGEAGKLAAARDFDAAQAALDELEALLKRASSASQTADENEADEAEGEADNEEGTVDAAALARYEARLSEVEPQLLDLFAARHPESTKLRAVLGYAAEQAEAGEFDKAIAALDRAAALAKATAPAASGEGYPGLVAYRKSLLGLRAAVGTVERQIAQLVAAIPGTLPDEADLAQELAEELRESTDALNDLVDEAMSGAEEQDNEGTRALREQLDGFIAEVQGSALIQHVDSNPFGVSLTVGKTLGDALGQVRQALPAFA